MSANIKWRPVKESGKDLGVWSPSRFIEMLEEAFGSLPAKIRKEDIPVLMGMRAAGDIHEKESLDKLIHAIETNTVVEVFAQY